MMDTLIYVGYFSIGFLCGALFFVAVYYKSLVALSWKVQNDLEEIRQTKKEVEEHLANMGARLDGLNHLASIRNASKKTIN